MAQETETFVFHSDVKGNERTVTADPSPSYTLTSKNTKSKEETKPRSVFTLRHTTDGQVEFTSNRRIVRLDITNKYNTEYGPKDWQCSTTIKADIIPSNTDVINQVEQDVHNAQNKAVLYADKVWDGKKGEKIEKTTRKPIKKRSWWPFKRTKAV